MSYFVIYKQDGEIARVISCPLDEIDLQLTEGERYITGNADPSKDSVDVALAVVIPNGKPAPPPVVQVESYSDIRKRMYPSTNEQLDMLWHAMDSGDAAKIEPFYSTIKAVKDAVPKNGALVFDVGAI